MRAEVVSIGGGCACACDDNDGDGMGQCWADGAMRVLLVDLPLAGRERIRLRGTWIPTVAA
jgi:hypothetical protein